MKIKFKFQKYLYKNVYSVILNRIFYSSNFHSMKKKTLQSEKSVVIYQAKSGAIEFQQDAKKETLWANQVQIAQAFDVDIRTVNEHIKTFYATKELTEIPTLRKFRTVQKEGGRQVERNINYYNLDMVLSNSISIVLIFQKQFFVLLCFQSMDRREENAQYHW